MLKFNKIGTYEESKTFVNEVRETLKQMGKYDAHADEQILIMLEQACDMYFIALEDIDRKGLSVGEGNYTRGNPACGVLRNAQNTIISILKECGCSVRGRRLVAEKVGTTDSTSPLAQFLAMAEDE